MEAETSEESVEADVVDIIRHHQKSSVNIRGWKGKCVNVDSVFQKAVRMENAYLVKILLENGANVNVLNEESEPALMYICKHREFRVTDYNEKIELLLQHGASVNITDENRNTPLHWTMEMGNIAVVEGLLKNGADINVKNERGQTPFMRLCSTRFYLSKDYDEKLKLLLQYGAFVNEKDNQHDGNTALHWVTVFGNIKAIETLIKNGADVNAFNKRGRTPLISLSKLGYCGIADYNEKIELFIQYGALLRGNRGNTAMHWVTKMGNVDSLNILLKKEFDVNILNGEGDTPLIFLCKQKYNHINDYNEKLELLLKHGALINRTDKCGNTSLHWAIKNGDIQSVRVLLENEADISILNKKGDTPFIFLCKQAFDDNKHYRDKMELLIKYGAVLSKEVGKTIAASPLESETTIELCSTFLNVEHPFQTNNT